RAGARTLSASPSTNGMDAVQTTGTPRIHPGSHVYQVMQGSGSRVEHAAYARRDFCYLGGGGGSMRSFDAIVIGAGQAGPSLAVRLAEAGRTVALIERRRLGGTCVNDGCIPTKTLVARARAAWTAREADRFGVRIEGAVSVDMKKVKAQKDA